MYVCTSSLLFCAYVCFCTTFYGRERLIRYMNSIGIVLKYYYLGFLTILYFFTSTKNYKLNLISTFSFFFLFLELTSFVTFVSHFFLFLLLILYFIFICQIHVCFSSPINFIVCVYIHIRIYIYVCVYLCALIRRYLTSYIN